MSVTESFLLFCVAEGRFAMDVAAVERIVRAVEVTRLSDAPDFVLGVINVAGEIMPVIDMRRRLGLAVREMELSDRFVLTQAAGKSLALLVDKVEGVVALAAQSISRGDKAAAWAATAAVGVEGSIVLIHDIDAFVSTEALSRLERPKREETNG